MIESDGQLQIVREQLATAEAALQTIRREVLPQNDEMYNVMAESYIDMILTLRAEIDAYLGVAATPQHADLVIALEGANARLGQISAASVTRFVDAFRRGLHPPLRFSKRSNDRMRLGDANVGSRTFATCPSSASLRTVSRSFSQNRNSKACFPPRNSSHLPRLLTWFSKA